MTFSDLVQRFVDHTGDDADAAQAALEGAAAAIGACLSKGDAESVAGDLGWPELAEQMREAAHGTVSDLDGFYASVTAAGVDAGRTVVHAQVAGQMLAEMVPPDVLVELRSLLPKAVAGLFEHAATMPPPAGLDVPDTIPPPADAVPSFESDDEDG